MPKQKIITYLLPTLFWTLVISILHYNWGFGLIWLWLGAIFGALLLQSDHLVYLLWQKPEELTSVRFKALAKQKRYREALALVFQTTGERTRLSFHTVLFQVVFIPICFLVLTSTGNTFGIGMVMGLFLSLLMEQIRLLLKNNYQELSARYFWPVQREIKVETQKWYVIVMIFMFTLFNFFLL